MLTLRASFATHSYTRALKDGSIKLPHAELEFVEFSPQSAAFQKMVPVAELDLVEMVLTHYLIARDYDKPFIAIPVFPGRQFHHGGVVYNVKSGIRTPKDLEGKRVGVRTYGVSRGFWARAFLAREYKVDISRVTWVVNDPEDIAAYRPPANVELVSGDLENMLEEGQIDAAIGVSMARSPDFKPLLDDANAAAAASFRTTGIYPINHLIVLRQELVDHDPQLPLDLFNAFCEAKAAFLGQVDMGAELGAHEKALAALRHIVGPDPMPYGIERNRNALQASVEEAAAQGLTSKQFAVDELFVPSVRGLG
ncbi:MAG TPA: ABC transporter substrate-binding protein [Dehalococcoidia bacterium]|nr:ABC transporter substrate-binding protein [Dehalococcoidia bacterium]